MSDKAIKELLWTAYWEGYSTGYGVEDMTALDERTARSNFERWFNINMT